MLSLLTPAPAPGRSLPESTEALLAQLPVEVKALYPSAAALTALTDAYFEHSDLFSPILDRNHFEAVCHGLEGSDAPAQSRFTAMAVFATAVLLLKRRDAAFPSSRADAYYDVAMKQLSAEPELLSLSRVQSLENLALMIQYSMLSDNLKAAWYLVGTATRMAIELGLHLRDNRQGNTGPWLFWTIYGFERILCQALDRPFSIPDAAVSTPLPQLASDEGPLRFAALHLIKERRLLSEMHDTISQSERLATSTLEFQQWRQNMRDRVLEWKAQVPTLDGSAPFAASELFDGFMLNSMVLLYFPPNREPQLSDADLDFLAESASRNVELYRTTFREGKLRYYWRTMQRLFRAGSALVYCITRVRAGLGPGSCSLSLTQLTAAVNMCSSVLWGMVERHHAGRAYRDQFDALVAKMNDENSQDLTAAAGDYLDFDEFSCAADMLFSMNEADTDILHGP